MTENEVEGLPANIDAERLVLGSVLAGYSDFNVITATLAIEDFAIKNHQQIFRRMSEVYARGDKVDRITVADELMKYSELESCGGLSYLVSLDDGLPQFPSLDQYCKILREKAILRKAIFACQEVIQQCLLLGDAKEILERAQTIIANLAEPVTPAALMTPEHVKLNTPGGIGAFLDPSSQRSRGVPSPWNQLNRLIYTIRGGQFVIVAARPSIGKSAAVAQWAYHAARCGFPAAIFSLEMSREAVLGRITCACASVDSHKYFSGHLNREERGRFLEASAAIDELPVRIDDSSIVTVPAMHAAVRRYNASNPKLRLVVVDYLQLMEATGRQENRVLELSQITRGLKRMAMELDVAILAACQLNRAAADDRPQLHNLRESGSIEQDADTVMFLWRDPRRAGGSNSARIETELIVAKQRNGPVGEAHLQLEGNFVRFHDPENGDVSV